MGNARFSVGLANVRGRGFGGRIRLTHRHRGAGDAEHVHIVLGVTECNDTPRVELQVRADRLQRGALGCLPCGYGENDFPRRPDRIQYVDGVGVRLPQLLADSLTAATAVNRNAGR